MGKHFEDRPKDTALYDAIQEVLDKDINGDQVYEFTQHIRRQFLVEATKDGMPYNPEAQSVILHALKDMDKQRMDRQRLNIDSDNANTNKMVHEIVKLMAERNQHGLADPSAAMRPRDLGPVDIVLDIEINEDEKHVGLVRTTSREFVAECERDGLT